MEYLEYTQKKHSFNLCTEYSQYFILYCASILDVLVISWCFLRLAHLVLKFQPRILSLINIHRAHSDRHTVFLSSTYRVFTLMAIQHFLHQHVWSSHWQPCSGSFLNMCEAHCDSHAMVLSSTYVELTITTMQCFFLQLKPEPFYATVPIPRSCECSPMY